MEKWNEPQKKQQKIIKFSKFEQKLFEEQKQNRKYQNFIDMEENDDKA